jgi:glycosyltransferase involved in cell wall biosynthesis/predicted  nucleic acid-binding Zn-ribbon protein
MSTKPIHFLKLDCEGDEFEILQSSEMQKNRPWIIIVESVKPRSNESLHEKIQDLLEPRNYKFTLFDGLNDFYVDKENIALANSRNWFPACILDNFQKYSHLSELESMKFEISQYKSDSQSFLGLFENAKADLKRFSDHSQKLEKSYTALSNEIHSVRSDLTTKTNEIESVRSDLTTKTNEIESLRSDLTTKTNEIDSLRSDLTTKTNEIESLRQESLIQSQAFENLKKEKAYIFDELEALTSSKIWKSTESYRKIRNRLNYVLKKVYEVWKREGNLFAFSKKVVFYVFSRLTVHFRQKAIKGGFRLTVNQDSPAEVIISETFGRQREFSALGRPISVVSALFKNDPYVLVGSTAQVSTNSGVQRVARSFVESLIIQGARPVLVKVDIVNKRIEHLDQTELKAFFAQIKTEVPPAYADPRVSRGKIENGILLIPEVPYLSQVDPLVCEVLLAYCNSHYLCSAAIYFDSIPLSHPEYKAPREAHEAYLRFLSSCFLVSSISKHSENELSYLLSQRKYLVSPNSPELITQHLPLPSQLIQSSPEEIIELRGRRFVIAVGTVEPRKNQGNLIKAFENVFESVEDSPILVIIGHIRPDVAEWKLNANPRKIIWISGASDESLNWLYENCIFTVFVSLLEGFGYPILESQYFKKICVTSNVGSMKEIAEKGGCILVNDPTSIKELETALIEANRRCNEDYISLDFLDWNGYTAEFYSRAKALIQEKSKEFQILYWVDHTIGFPANTGIQRVVRGLARTLLSAGLEVVPVKWNSDVSNFQVPTEIELNNLQNWNGPEAGRFNLDFQNYSNKPRFLVIPELTTYAQDDHFLKKIIEFAKSLGIPVVSVFHDALPVKLTQIYSPAASRKHMMYMTDLIGSDLIFTTSKSGHNDLSEFILSQKSDFQSTLSRLVRIDLPAIFTTHRHKEIESKQINKSEGKGKGCKILCVGTLEPRKNHIKLLESFKILVNNYEKDNVELILVGRSADELIAQEVIKASERFPISWKGQVSDEELEELYHSCNFTIFPSIAEGFGLPILESLSFGKPAICGYGSAFDQLAEQGGCLQVDVNDPEALAAAISSLIDDTDLYHRLVLDSRNINFNSWEEYGSDFTKNLLNLTLRESKL